MEGWWHARLIHLNVAYSCFDPLKLNISAVVYEVEWSLPTILGMSQSKAAKLWVLGDGGATDQAVADARWLQA